MQLSFICEVEDEEHQQIYILVSLAVPVISNHIRPVLTVSWFVCCIEGTDTIWLSYINVSLILNVLISLRTLHVLKQCCSPKCFKTI